MQSIHLVQHLGAQACYLRLRLGTQLFDHRPLLTSLAPLGTSASEFLFLRLGFASPFFQGVRVVEQLIVSGHEITLRKSDLTSSRAAARAAARASPTACSCNRASSSGKVSTGSRAPHSAMRA